MKYRKNTIYMNFVIKFNVGNCYACKKNIQNYLLTGTGFLLQVQGFKNKF